GGNRLCLLVAVLGVFLLGFFFLGLWLLLGLGLSLDLLVGGLLFLLRLRLGFFLLRCVLLGGFFLGGFFLGGFFFVFWLGFFLGFFRFGRFQSDYFVLWQRLLQFCGPFGGNLGLPHVQLLEVLEAGQGIQAGIADLGRVEVEI